MRKKEKPIHIIRRKNSHTETRVFRRDIHESYCAKKSCKFYGKHAAQGICWPALDKGFPHGYFDRLYETSKESIELQLAQLKNKPKSYQFEAMKQAAICSSMNHRSCLDELIKLRIENAKMRIELGKWR